MTLVNYTSRNWGLKFAKESTFGTAIAVTAGTNGWITLPTESMPSIDGDVSHEDLMLTDTDRIQSSTSIYTSTNNSIPTVKFSTPYRRELAGYLIAGAMQTASPGNVLNTTPYAHTWTLNTTQPDFTANAGYFYTVCLTGPIAGEDQLLTSCILSDLAIVITPPAKGKANLVMLEGTFWSPFARTFGNTFAATPSTPSTNFMLASKFKVTNSGGSTSYPIRSARIEIASNPFKIPTGGTAATIGFNIPFAQPKMKVSFYYNDYTKGFISAMQSGTIQSSIIVTNSVATTSMESLVATTYARITNDPLADDGGNSVLNVEYDLVSSSGNAPISMVTTDDISTF